jgi:hypothetical protein
MGDFRLIDILVFSFLFSGEVYRLSEENDMLVTKLMEMKDFKPSNEKPIVTVSSSGRSRSYWQTTCFLLLLLVTACAVVAFASLKHAEWDHIASCIRGSSPVIVDSASSSNQNLSLLLSEAQVSHAKSQGAASMVDTNVECPICQNSKPECPVVECPAVKECAVEPQHACMPCPEEKCPVCEKEKHVPTGSANCVMATQSLSMCANQVSTFALELQRLERYAKACMYKH